MNKKLIPIFFASDDNYLPYLDVAISSLIEHTSQNNFYSIYILNTGLKDEYKARIFGSFHTDFWFSIYFLTTSRETLPTEAIKQLRVHRLGSLDLSEGNSFLRSEADSRLRSFTHCMTPYLGLQSIRRCT